MRMHALFVGVLLLALLASGCTSAGGPRIELSARSFDFGDIDPDEGIRTERFSVRNRGDSALVISSVSTSCGCTTAEISSKEILLGEEAELAVSYDPNMHPGLVGEIKRVVYIQSNDPSDPEVQLELYGNSLPAG